MSNYTDLNARDDLVQEIVNLWDASTPYKDITLFGENQPEPNYDLIASFCYFKLDFTGATQATLGQEPVDRTWGIAEFRFGVREGEGSRLVRGMRSYMKTNMKARTIGCVKTTIPRPGALITQRGWTVAPLYVPLYFDSSPVSFFAP